MDPAQPDRSQNLIPTEEVINRAKSLGVKFGFGDSNNRIRYLVKNALIPHQSRKFKDGRIVAHLPETVVDRLVEIQRLQDELKYTIPQLVEHFNDPTVQEARKAYEGEDLDINTPEGQVNLLDTTSVQQQASYVDADAPGGVSILPTASFDKEEFDLTQDGTNVNTTGNKAENAGLQSGQVTDSSNITIKHEILGDDSALFAENVESTDTNTVSGKNKLVNVILTAVAVLTVLAGVAGAYAFSTGQENSLMSRLSSFLDNILGSEENQANTNQNEIDTTVNTGDIDLGQLTSNVVGEVLSALVINIPTEFRSDITASDINLNLEGSTLEVDTITANNILYSIIAGDGIQLDGTQDVTIVNSGVLSLGGQTGDVELQAGEGITVDGTEISNSGVTSLGGETGDIELTAGADIDINGLSIALQPIIDTVTQVNFPSTGFLDLSAVTHSSSALQGIKLPQSGSFTNLSAGEGFLAWDTSNNKLITYNGSAWEFVAASSDPNSLDYDDFVDAMTLDATTSVNFYDGSSTYDYRFRNSNTSTEIIFMEGASGELGLGTITPNDKLDVVGNIDTTTHYEIGNVKVFDYDTNWETVMVGNEALASYTGGSENVAIGHEALYTLDFGYYAVAVGAGALRSATDAQESVAVGYQALYRATDGYANTALGSAALYDLTTGNYNIGVGISAASGGSAGITGEGNIGMGLYSLDDLTSGDYNVGIGIGTLDDITTGTGNIALGRWAGNGNRTGSENIFIGREAGIGSSARTGSDNNIAIGYQAGFNLGNDDDANIFLGYQAGYNETASNKLYIENSNATSADALIYGDFSTDTLTFNGDVGIDTINPLASFDAPEILTEALTLSPGNTISGFSGFNTFTNVTQGFGTNGLVRLTSGGDLKNIRSIAANNIHLRSGGTFAAKVDYSTVSTVNDVAAADFDGDGYMDLVGVGSGIVSVHLNDGDGTFAANVDYTVASTLVAVEAGDLNGDGFIDIATSNYTTDIVYILLNDGDGTFADEVSYSVGDLSSGNRSMAIADFNRDGRPEVAVGGAVSDEVYVLVNNGDGTFASYTTVTSTNDLIDIKSGDMNGDGHVDIITASQSTNLIGILIGNGDATFDAPVTYATSGQPFGLVIDDFNLDGALDVANSSLVSGGGLSVLLNDGDGTLATAANYATTAWPRYIAAADFNGDGYPDLVTVNQLAANASVLLNDGDGTFGANVDYAVGNTPVYVIAEDFNNDSLPDIVAANTTDSDLSVLLNSPTSVLYADGYDGNVGIGTSTPTGRLQVTGDEVRIGDAGTADFATADGDLYVEDTLEVDGSFYLAGTQITSGGSELNLLDGATATAGGVVFGNGTNFTQDATNFFWDNTNDFLGLGTNTPGAQLSLSSTSTSASYNGFDLNWAPGSATTLTGDLFSINIGANGTAANLFAIYDNSTPIFSVSETSIESAVPHAFTAAGDVSMSYDLNLTNTTASYINFEGPGYIRTTHPSANNDLTLSAANSGQVIVNDNFKLYSADPAIVYDTLTATDTDFWAGVVEDGGGDDDDLFSIGDGTTVGTNSFLSINTSGNVGLGTTSPNNRLEVLSTTSPQLRVAYDTSNYYTTAVSSAGAVTFDATGASAGFTFSDALSVAGNILPGTADTYDLGSTTAEWNRLYLGDDAGLLFGADQDFSLFYDETTDDRLELGDGTNTFLSVVDGGSTATFNFTGNLLPTTNDTYNLGSDSLRWADAFLGPGTLHIGTSTSDEYTLSYDTTSNYLGFNVNGSGDPEIVMNSSGYLGLGTTDPGSARLNIVGNGDVVIGSVPNAPYNSKLDVTKSGSDLLSLQNSSAADGAYAEARFMTGGYAYAAIHGGNTSYGTDRGYIGFLTRTTGGTMPERMRLNYLGNFGIGTTDPNNRLEVLSTTSPQLRVAYDTSNYYTTAVSNAGAVTFDATGASGGFTFSDAVNITGALTTTGNILPGTADTYDLGTTTAEWNRLYLGDDAGLLFGNDQDWSFFYDETTDDRLELATAGTSGIGISTATVSGTALSLTADSLTTGTGFSMTTDALTSGTGFLLESDGSNTISGDLFKLRIGASTAVSGNIFAIYDDTTPLFTVDQAGITSALPHSFTSAGDVSFAYDTVYTNQTASTIQAYGPLTIESGEAFENLDLTLKPSGSGSVIVDAGSDLELYTSEALIFDTDDSGDSYLTHEAAEDRIRVYVDGTEMFRFDSAGNESNDTITTTAFDLAETYPTMDESLEAGDVVAVGGFDAEEDLSNYMVSKVEPQTMSNVLGVVSSKPGFRLGGGSFNSEFCALVETDEATARNNAVQKELSIIIGDQVTAEMLAGEIKVVENATAEELLDTKNPLKSKQQVIDQRIAEILFEEGELEKVLGNGLVNAIDDKIQACKSVKQVDVALAGRVPVKFDNSNGEIKAGDLLTSSTTSFGKAAKLISKGWAIGRALEDSSEDKETIMMFVMLSWHTGDNDLSPAYAANGQVLSSTASNVNYDNLSQALTAVTKVDTDADGKKRLAVYSNLNVLGTVNGLDIATSGTISAGFLKIDGSNDSITVLGGGDLKLQSGDGPLGNIEAFNGKLVMTTDGGIISKASIEADTIAAREFKVLGATDTNDSSVGEGKFESGQTEVTIENSNVKENSKVFVTLTSESGSRVLVVKEKVEGSFKAKLSSSSSSPITFDYWIVGIED